jgi:hypothetical protein
VDRGEVSVTMQDLSDDKPRMSAEEADAKFAALVAGYRAEKRPRRERKPLVDGYGGLAMLVVYLIGVGLGAVWHNTVGKAVVVGLLVAVVRWGWMRFSTKADE